MKRGVNITLIALLVIASLSFCAAAAAKISRAGEVLGLFCHELDGSRNIVTHNLGELHFRGIEAATAAKVTVRSADDPDCDVILRVNENMAELVELKVRNGILKIGLKSNCYSFKTLNDMTFEVSVPHCDGLSSLEAAAAAQIVVTSPLTAPKIGMEAAGASKITAGIDCQECKAEAAGASKITLAGRSARLSAEAAGASKIDAVECETERCDAEAVGASKIKVWCTEQLSAEAVGASKVAYRGDCEISVSTAGASSVKRIN